MMHSRSTAKSNAKLLRYASKTPSIVLPIPVAKMHDIIELKTGAEVAWYPDSQYDEKYAERPAILIGKTITDCYFIYTF